VRKHIVTIAALKNQIDETLEISRGQAELEIGHGNPVGGEPVVPLVGWRRGRADFERKFS
jgi:hypothetical protein